MAALLIVMCGLSTTTILVLVWLRLRLRNSRESYADEKQSLETNELINGLNAGQAHVFWTGIWRAIVRAERKKLIHQVFNNYALLLTGIIPLVVSCLAVLGKNHPLLESVDVILNVCVSAVALILGKFGFAKYAEMHERTAYMLTAALNDYLSGSGDYFGLALDVRFVKLHDACQNIRESNTTSIVGERSPTSPGGRFQEAMFIVDADVIPAPPADMFDQDEPTEKAISEYDEVFQNVPTTTSEPATVGATVQAIATPDRIEQTIPETVAVKPEDFGQWQASALADLGYDEITQG